MNGDLDEIRQNLTELLEAENGLRLELATVDPESDLYLELSGQIDAIHRQRDRLKLDLTNEDFQNRAQLPTRSLDSEDRPPEEWVEDPEDIEALFLALDEISERFDEVDTDSDPGLGPLPDYVMEIGDPPQESIERKEKREPDKKEALRRWIEGLEKEGPLLKNAGEKPAEPARELIEIGGEQVIELMDILPPMEDEDIDEWLADLGYRWRTIDLGQLLTSQTTIHADILISIGRQIGTGTRLVNVPNWVPDSILRYIEHGISLSANRDNEDYRSTIPRRGYYDQFGYHRSFCMSCHDPTNPAADLKRSAAFAGNEWEIFWMGLAAELIPIGRPAKLASTAVRVGRSLRLGARILQMRTINISHRILNAMERAMARSMPAAYRRAMMRGMIMPHVEISLIAGRLIPRAVTGRAHRYVYRLLKDGEPVYYGITNNPRARIIEHALEKQSAFDEMEVMTDLLPTTTAQELEAGLVWRHLSRAPAERFTPLARYGRPDEDLVLKMAGLLNDEIPGGRTPPAFSWASRQHHFIDSASRVRMRNPLYTSDPARLPWRWRRGR